MAQERSRAEHELEEIDTVFEALAHPLRRHVLVVLRARGDGMTAGEIAGRFSCQWPTVTRHLRKLESARLVRKERRGREIQYRLDRKHLQKVAGAWIGYFKPETS